jgi:hypothetical protein
MICAVMAFGGYHALLLGRIWMFAIVAGVGVAALALTKINLGVFAACSVIGWVLLHVASPQVRRYAPVILAIGAVVLPAALLRPLLSQPWVQTLGLVFCTGTLSLIATARSTGCGFTSRHAVITLLAAAIITLSTLSIVMPRGTSVAELINGIALAPLKHPTTFSSEYAWPRGTIAAALAAAMAAMVACYFIRRGNQHRLDTILAMARLILSIVFAAAILRFPARDPIAFTFPWCVPILWIFIWPFEGEDARITAANSWLAWLALGQWLHAFPVPVSQAGWGSFLALPIAALGAVSAGRKVFSNVIAKHQTATRLITTVALVAFLATSAYRTIQLATQLNESQPLHLAGAENLRLPDSVTFAYRILTANAAAHADVLFSLPGMFSLNLWSGVPAPTLANTTHWFSLLDSSRQHAIKDVLEARPNSCIIVEVEHVDFLRRLGIPPRGTLYEYITNAYETAFRIDDFEFRVRKGRRIAPLFVAEILQRADALPGQDTLLRVPVFLPHGENIHSIEIEGLADSSAATVVLDNTSARIEVTPIDLTGQAAGASRVAAFPIRAERPTMLSVYYNRRGATYTTARTRIILRDEERHDVALVRLQL